MTKLLLVMLFIFSVPAMAEDLGTCKLKGKYHAGGVIFLPWTSEKKTLKNVNIGRCIAEAKMLLDYENYAVIDDCAPSGGPCYEREVKITIRKVKYKFASKVYKTKGSIKKRRK